MTASAASTQMARARRRGRNEVRLVGSIGINDTGESTNSLGITGAADLAQGPHCSAAHGRKGVGQPCEDGARDSGVGAGPHEGDGAQCLEAHRRT
jgi:hypothetical protein